MQKSCTEWDEKLGNIWTISISVFYQDNGCMELTNHIYFTLVSIHNTIIHEDGWAIYAWVWTASLSVEYHWRYGYSEISCMLLKCTQNNIINLNWKAILGIRLTLALLFGYTIICYFMRTSFCKKLNPIRHGITCITVFVTTSTSLKKKWFL